MTNTQETLCARTLKHLDAFIDRELDSRTAAAVEQHVHECGACSAEMQLRSTLRERLRSATRNDAPSPFLQTRVLARLRRQERPSPWLQRSAWAPTAAALLLMTVGLSVAYQLGHLRFTVASQNRYIDSMLQKVSFAMGVGLSDHIHCAVFRKYAKQAPAVETLRADLPPEHRGVLTVVQAGVPRDFTAHLAHECTFRGRAYIHIAMKNDTNLISLILTRRRAGETLVENGLTPVISRGGLDLYGASAQRFQMSGFETATHFAYLVSDASPAETHRLMLAIGGELRNLISNLPA